MNTSKLNEASNSLLSPENLKSYKQFNNDSYLKNEKILNYLSINPLKSRRFKKEGSVYEIYDIIDGIPIYLSTDNSKASQATKTNNLNSGGNLNLNLNGVGYTVGVWDAGPAQFSHPEFLSSAEESSSRIIVVDNSPTGDGTNPDDHGTHVSGTIAASGIDSSAKGMAPEVTVKSYNWLNDRSEVLLAIKDLNNPILISNHSYGVPINTDDGQVSSDIIGTYNSEARAWDQIHFDNRKYLMVTSAGNSGQVSHPSPTLNGYDKLIYEKNSKNNLVVANANPIFSDPFSSDFTSIVINPSSSQGPSDDLRIKPIYGDGTNVYSTDINSSYSTKSGTSMAAPNVAGSLVLLHEYEKIHGSIMNSSTVKALIINTAIDDAQSVGRIQDLVGVFLMQPPLQLLLIAQW